MIVAERAMSYKLNKAFVFRCFRESSFRRICDLPEGRVKKKQRAIGDKILDCVAFRAQALRHVGNGGKNPCRTCKFLGFCYNTRVVTEKLASLRLGDRRKDDSFGESGI